MNKTKRERGGRTKNKDGENRKLQEVEVERAKRFALIYYPIHIGIPIYMVLGRSYYRNIIISTNHSLGDINSNTRN